MATRPPDDNADELSACKAHTATVALEGQVSRVEEATEWNFHDPKEQAELWHYISSEFRNNAAFRNFREPATLVAVYMDGVMKQ